MSDSDRVRWDPVLMSVLSSRVFRSGSGWAQRLLEITRSRRGSHLVKDLAGLHHPPLTTRLRTHFTFANQARNQTDLPAQNSYLVT